MISTTSPPPPRDEKFKFNPISALLDFDLHMYLDFRKFMKIIFILFMKLSQGFSQ